MGALSKIKSPFAEMGLGQKIAAVALAVLALIALVALTSGTDRSTAGSSPSSGFTPASYSSAPGDSSAPGATTETSSNPADSSESSATPSDGLATVPVAALPSQARDTIALIDAGGPYPYSRDGIVFGNRERILPKHPSGWYHEYTVKTPGESDRGARRIIAGKDGTLYYTADHYASFKRVIR